jgi:hypothetical protein
LNKEKINMSIDYKQLKILVKEAMFTGGGINEPSAPVGIPHRMAAADRGDKQQDMGDPKANKLYELALVAREATEKLVEALDEPIFDDAYEQAFKASACLRRTLNSIEGTGAHPMPFQHVVAPTPGQQKYSGGARSAAGDYAGGAAIGGNFAMGLEEVDLELPVGIGPSGQKAVQSLQKITDPDEITAISNYLIGSPQFPGVTGKSGA